MHTYIHRQASDLCSESLFFDIDTDVSGTIDFNEFSAAFGEGKIAVQEAEVGRLFIQGPVPPAEQQRYANICKFFPLLSVDPSTYNGDGSVADEDEAALDAQRAKIKADMRRTLEARLAAAETKHQATERKLADAKRELGLLPSVTSPVSVSEQASDQRMSELACDELMS